MRKLLISLLVLSLPSFAGGANGHITQILSHTDQGNGQGVFMFVLDGVRSDAPECSVANGGKAWAMSLENESGRAMYSLILSAQAQGRKIEVIGRGHCNVWGDREEPRYVIMTVE